MDLFREIEDGNLSKIRDVLMNHPDLRKVNNYGLSPLGLSAALGQLNCVRMLIQSGADPNWGGFSGTPLMLSAHEGHKEIVDVLIQAKAKVNEKDEDGATALMGAAAMGHLAVVQQLVQAGAKINVLSQHGDFALLSAASNGHQEVVDYLLPLTSERLHKKLRKELSVNSKSKSPKIDPRILEFVEAAGRGNLEVVKKLIGEGMDVNARGMGNGTALLNAASMGCIEVMKVLIGAGAEVNVRADDGSTPLMYACFSSPDAVQMLLESGADPNLKDHRGTALWYAIEFSERTVEVVQLLLQYGIDINIRDKYGMSGLERAQLRQKTDVVSLLLRTKQSD